jgi:hypothetical protein
MGFHVLSNIPLISVYIFKNSHDVAALSYGLAILDKYNFIPIKNINPVG